ncbi:MAG: hypothetical protein V2A73_17010, partial [Pseudomonadota bacterium]
LQIITRGMKIEAPKEGSSLGPYALGYAVAGKFRSHFADNPIPAGVTTVETEKQDSGNDSTAMSIPTPGEPVKESPAGTRVVVLGSAEFVADSLMTSLRALGGSQFMNGFRAFHDMVDWLAQDSDLVSIRSKMVNRPLKGLEKRDRLLLKYGNSIGVPLILMLYGIASWRLRERRRRNISL